MKTFNCVMIRILLLVLVHAIVDCDENILLKKPIMARSSPAAWMDGLNDGSESTCCWMYYRNTQFVLFDLGAIYSINKLRLKIGWYVPKPKQPYRIYASEKYEPCIHAIMTDGMELCYEYNTVNNKETVPCKRTGIQARYILIRKGNYTTPTAEREDFNLCEFQVFGSKIKDIIAPTPFTMLESDESKSGFTNDFSITRKILGPTGKQTITIPNYGGTLINLDSNCQPIIWNDVKKKAFSQACQTADGKGRIVLFGKQHFFTETMQTNSEFKQNLLKWLSPSNSNPQIHDSLSFSSVSDLKSKIKTGDIVIYNCYKTHNKDIHNELKSLLLKGEIALSFDKNIWFKSTTESLASQQEIYDLFNINYIYSFITWSSALTVNLDMATLTDDYIGSMSDVRRMLGSYSYTMENGLRIVDQLLRFPTKTLTRSSIKDDLIKMIKYYQPYVQSNCPCKAKPATDSNVKKFLYIYTKLASLPTLQNSGIKSPCIKAFPGDFKTEVVGKTVTLELKGITQKTKNPIGYYLRAGETLKYKIIKSTGKWSISIGCHTDVLKLTQNKWLRLPNVHAGDFDLFGTEGYSYSPYGGNLWLYNQNVGDTLTIELSNVIETPFLNMRDNASVKNWENSRNAPGLWAQLAGDNLVMCVSSDQIRKFSIDTLKELFTENWDKLVRLDYVFKHLSWTDKRPEIFVIDIQPNAGYGHSGYPIVVYDDWFDSVFNLQQVRGGAWGLCHEVGHNMQEAKWTFSSSEITNNVFCMYNYDKLWNKKLYGTLAINEAQRETKDNLIKFLKAPTYSRWKTKVFFALTIYGQLVDHLGWNFYRKVFHYYETNKLNPTSEQDKIDTWIITTSKLAQQNLSPLFEFYGFVITDKVKTETASLKCFMPDDVFTKLVPERTNQLIEKYKPCNRVSPVKYDIDEKNMLVGIRENFIKTIS